jgi:putative phage-type endonuclease
MINLRTVSKPQHGSQEWLTLRWKDENGLARISASNAACVHGENPYKTKAEFAKELMQPSAPTPSEPTPDMERGNRLEPVLLRWYADMNEVEIHIPEVMYVADRLIATLDGWSNNTPVEVKTTRKRWANELPRHWYWQGVQQAICTGRNKIIWVIFDSELNMHVYEQTISSDEMITHIVACKEFLEHVDQGQFPPGSDITIDLASDMWPTSKDVSIDLDESAREVLQEIVEVRAQIAALESFEKTLRGAVGMLLGEASVGMLDGKPVVEWKTVGRNTFDTKAFEKAHPALASKFMKRQEYRVMKFPKQKGNGSV